MTLLGRLRGRQFRTPPWLAIVAILVAIVALGIGGGLVLVKPRSVALASAEVLPGPRNGAPPVVARNWPVILDAARRHNTLPVSNYEFARLMEQMLTVEQGGDVCTDQIVCVSQLWYPFWSRLQATTNDERQTNASVGPGQIRPETAYQLERGWIKHGGRVVWHGVTPRVTVLGPDGGVVSSRLEQADVSIEYLAANLAMGAAVARAFDHEPTLDDLARWHNTGVGWWTWKQELVPDSVWAKGGDYIQRVHLAGDQLSGGVAPARAGLTPP